MRAILTLLVSIFVFSSANPQLRHFVNGHWWVESPFSMSLTIGDHTFFEEHPLILDDRDSVPSQTYKDTIHRFIRETQNELYQPVLKKWFDSADYYKCAERCGNGYDSIWKYLGLHQKSVDSIGKYFYLTYPILKAHPYWIDMLIDGEYSDSSCKCQP